MHKVRKKLALLAGAAQGDDVLSKPGLLSSMGVKDSPSKLVIILPCQPHEELFEKCLEKTQYDGDSGIGLFLNGKFMSHLPLPVKFSERRDIAASTPLASERERERVFHTSFLVYLYVRLGCPRLLIISPALVCSY